MSGLVANWLKYVYNFLMRVDNENTKNTEHIIWDTNLWGDVQKSPTWTN